MSVFRGILIGAGSALGLCSQTESLNDIPRSMLKGALNGYDKLSSKSSSQGSNLNDPELKSLAEEIQALKILASKSSNERQVIVYGSNSGSSTIVKVILVSTAGACVCYYYGVGFSDIMYVTKSTLNKAVEKLENQVEYVGVKLENTREQLLAMISSVEETIFSTSKELQTQIDTETAKINCKIDGLDDKFEKIETSQQYIKSSTKKLDSQISVLQNKFDRNGLELEKANSGIRLLINSVVDLPHVRQDTGLYSDLKTFLTQGFSWLTPNTSTTPEDVKEKNNPSFTEFLKQDLN